MFKKLFCKLGWHSFDYDIVPYDTPIGTQARYKCQWCGYEDLVDSQGNLF